MLISGAQITAVRQRIAAGYHFTELPPFNQPNSDNGVSIFALGDEPVMKFLTSLELVALTDTKPTTSGVSVLVR